MQLKDRFTEKYEKDIQKLKKEHDKDIEKLKEEHLRVLNGALERARRRSLRDSDKTEIEILRERLVNNKSQWKLVIAMYL